MKKQFLNLLMVILLYVLAPSANAQDLSVKFWPYVPELNTWDIDSDGFLDENPEWPLLKEHMIETYDMYDIEFQHFDLDQDGKISQSEYNKFFIVRFPEPYPGPNLNNALIINDNYQKDDSCSGVRDEFTPEFENWDIDGNGMIDKPNEWPALLQYLIEVYGMNDVRFEDYDKNNDGNITQKEYSLIWKNHL